MKIYVACLASYNSGRMHGAWIDLEGVDADDIREAIAGVLKGSPEPGAEEWAIHDYDDDTGALHDLGEHPDIDDLAARVEAVEEIALEYPDDIVKHLVEWVSDKTEPGNWKAHLNDAYGGQMTPKDYAAEMAESCGEPIPEHLQHYIDWAAMARDMALNGEVDFLCEFSGDYLQDHGSMNQGAIVLRNL